MADIVQVITKATDAFLDINTITVDNWTFKLFYKWTVTLLVTWDQYYKTFLKCD